VRFGRRWEFQRNAHGVGAHEAWRHRYRGGDPRAGIDKSAVNESSWSGAPLRLRPNPPNKPVLARCPGGRTSPYKSRLVPQAVIWPPRPSKSGCHVVVRRHENMSALPTTSRRRASLPMAGTLRTTSSTRLDIVNDCTWASPTISFGEVTTHPKPDRYAAESYPRPALSKTDGHQESRR